MFGARDDLILERFAEVTQSSRVIPFREGIRRTLAWFDAAEPRKRVDASVNAEMDRIIKAFTG